MKHEEELFRHCPVGLAILRLAIPTVISQIILVVYNMADTFFIGLGGDDAMLTAVTVCMPAFMILSAISNLFGVGGASVMARSMGSGNRERAALTSSFAFWGCVIVSGLYAVGALLLRDPVVNLLGGSDPMVHSEARTYLFWTVTVGGIATSLNALLGHLVRSEGRSLEAGIGIALGGVLNILLDPLLMFVVVKQPVLGAALATMLSNVAAVVYFFIIIKRKTAVISLKPHRESLFGGIPGEVMATGLPACLMTLFENISYAVLDNLMGLCGIAMQAGIGVAKKVNMLAHCMVRGMTQGVLPLIAYNFASGDHRRMKRVVLTATSVSVLLAASCTAVCLGFSRGLVGIFIHSESASLRFGADFLRILCIGGPFSACAYAFISFFQAVGEGRQSFLLAILRKGILDIPLMFLLRVPLPIYGIVWATPIADIFCCATAIILFARFWKTLKASQQTA